MPPIISISNLSKTYASGHRALKGVNLEIRKGEIFALLGPNGASKTTLISIVCGIGTATEGSVVADGHDVARDYRAARALRTLFQSVVAPVITTSLYFVDFGAAIGTRMTQVDRLKS
jgi:ABC-type multidrug transport system ATPase subunit